MITGHIWACRCGRVHRAPVVPIHIANKYKTQAEELAAYINDGIVRAQLRHHPLWWQKEAAGDETVLLPVSTLNAIAERAEKAERELRELQERLPEIVANVMQMDMLRRCHEDRSKLKQELRELKRHQA